MQNPFVHTRLRYENQFLLLYEYEQSGDSLRILRKQLKSHLIPRKGIWKREQELFLQFDQIPSPRRLEKSIVSDQIEYQLPAGDALINVIREGQLNSEEKFLIAEKLIEIVISYTSKGYLFADLTWDLFWYDSIEAELYLLDASMTLELSNIEENYNVLLGIEPDMHTMSPEQSFQTNSIPDVRSNYYSLGIILYSLFTSTIAFQGTDRVSVIYKHLSQLPVSPAKKEPSIGEALSAFIMKLISKNPKDRYQTAEGLNSDFKAIRDAVLNEKDLGDFIAGQKDFPLNFSLPDNIFARKDITTRLLHTAGEVSKGGKTVLFLTGPSGVGTTYIVDDFLQKLDFDDYYIGTGDFSHSSGNAFKGLRELTSDLLSQLFMEDHTIIASVREALEESISELSGVLITFHSDFENLFEIRSELQELSGVESLNRFIYAYTEFLKALQINNKSVIISLRNIEKADIGTFRLIEQLLTSSFIHHSMVLLSSEEVEVQPDTQYHEFINKLNEKNSSPEKLYNLEEIQVQNFTEVELLEILSQLRIEPLKEFAEILYNKTNGNYSFIKQLFEELISQKILQPNKKDQIWEIDLKAVARIDLSDDLHQFLIERMKQLDIEEIDVLKSASAIGYNFKLSQLYKIIDKDNKEAGHIINRLREKGFLLPFSYELAQLSELQFSHPGYLSVFNSITSQEELELLKAKIVDSIITELKEEELEQRLYELVAHIMPLDKNKCREYVPLVKKAAYKAKNEAAFELAGNYFDKVVSVISNDNTHSDLYDMAYEAALCALYSLKYDHYNRRLKSLKDLVASPIDGYRIYILEATKSIQRANFKLTIDILDEGLKKMGYRFTKTISKWDVLRLFFKSVWKSRKLNAENIEQLPFITDRKLNIAHRLISICAPAVYFLEPKLSTRLTWLGIKDTVEKGLLTETPTKLLALAFSINNFSQMVDNALRLSDAGLKLLENQIRSKSIKVSTYFLYGSFLQHLRDPLSDCILTLEDNYKRGREAGNTHMAFYCLGMNRWFYLFDATPMDKLKEYLDASHLLAKDSNQLVIDYYHRIIKSIVAELTRGHFFDESLADSELPINYSKLKQSPFARDRVIILNMHMSKLIIDHGRGVINKDEDLLREMFEIIREGGWGPYNSIVHILYACLHFLKGKKKIRGIKNSQVNKLLEVLKVRMPGAPFNYAAKYHFLKAVRYMVEDHNTKAEQEFSMAYRYAMEYGNLWDMALISEEYGVFLNSIGFSSAGMNKLREAIKYYDLWGAHSIVNRLIIEYPELAGVKLAESDPGVGSRERTDAIKSSDLENLLQLSRKIVNSKSLESQVNLLFDAAGAFTNYTRAAFVVVNDNQFQIFADKERSKGDSLVKSREGENIPVSILRLVMRRKKTLMITDAAANSQYRSDSYVLSNHTRSILCIPFVKENVVRNIFYLENELMANAFTTAQKDFLQLLCSQVMISIDNSVLTEMLEEKLKARARQIQAERDKSDALLRNILPEKIAKELKENGRIRARKHDSVSVLFTDFKDFSKFSESLSADQIIYEIDQCYRAFDDIVEKYGLEKIKTIGDSYMCAAGIPDAREGHEKDTVNAALEMIQYITTSNEKRRERGVPPMDIRTGIHTGPVIAGIVGHKKYVYDIWGTTVNIASRMESSGEAGRLNISGATYLKVKDDFECEFRGQIEAKSVGSVDMYFVKRIY